MAEIKDPENTILMELKGGTVTIELLPAIAPGHCERMKELARAGHYDNVAFHRVIDGFMAQTGDVQHANMEKDYNPRMAGTGGSDLPDLKAEFSKIPQPEPQQRQQPVLYQFQRQPFPEWTIHGLWPGDRGHGACRCHHARRAAREPGPDDQRQGGRRCIRSHLH